jgi:hypothetical protein
MQKVNGKTIASLKQEFNGWPAGTLLLVEAWYNELQTEQYYRAWHSFNKNIGSDIGLVPAIVLQ